MDSEAGAPESPFRLSPRANPFQQRRTMRTQAKQGRIVVAGNRPENRDCIREILEPAEFEVIIAETGRAALKEVRETRVSAVIVDFQTAFDSQDPGPPRVGSTLNALRDHDAFLPIVLTCEPNVRVDIETAFMADLILRHPIESAELLDGIDMLLSESMRERAARKAHFAATLDHAAT